MTLGHDPQPPNDEREGHRHDAPQWISAGIAALSFITQNSGGGDQCTWTSDMVTYRPTDATEDGYQYPHPVVSVTGRVLSGVVVEQAASAEFYIDGVFSGESDPEVQPPVMANVGFTSATYEGWDSFPITFTAKAEGQAIGHMAAWPTIRFLCHLAIHLPSGQMAAAVSFILSVDRSGYVRCVEEPRLEHGRAYIDTAREGILVHYDVFADSQY